MSEPVREPGREDEIRVEEAGRERILEPARAIGVAYDVDVVVAGGGISGVFAALAAARTGARTLLIDRFGMVGATWVQECLLAAAWTATSSRRRNRIGRPRQRAKPRKNV